MKTKTNIIINTSFPAFHNWVGAPDEFEYLQHMHRHVFHVQIKMKVWHDNRGIEFIDAKTKFDAWLRKNYQNEEMVNTSCEMLCKHFLDFLTRMYGPIVEYIRVLEDGENGAEICLVT